MRDVEIDWGFAGSAKVVDDDRHALTVVVADERRAPFEIGVEIDDRDDLRQLLQLTSNR